MKLASLKDGRDGRLVVVSTDLQRYLHASEAAPSGPTTLQAALDEQGRTEIPVKSGLAVSVPGCVDDWFTMHERYCKLPMAELLAPAIRYAREGFPLTQVIAEFLLASSATFMPFDQERVPQSKAITLNSKLSERPMIERPSSALARAMRSPLAVVPSMVV